MKIRHFPGYFRDGLMLFDPEKLTLLNNVTDMGHTHPSLMRPWKYITNGTRVTDHNDTVAQRIRFECQPGCTECCRQQGFVYLSEADLVRAAKFVGMSAAAFERKYVYRTSNRMRLRVPRRAHCHFLHDGGCGIHPAKPTQCRIFPFWPELVDSPRAWAKTASYCPGIGKGRLIQVRSAQVQAEEMRQEHPKLYG